PLLTNKSIFPLSQDITSYETFSKIRTFSHILNLTVQKNLKPFSDPDIKSGLHSALKGIA
ncbi:hypothetical protein ACFLSX_05745, partial [Calditrichota bacterium]